MNRSLAWKLGTIGLLMLVLLIPLNMIDGLIAERQQHRQQVLDDIARSASYRQQITGPLLVVPYRKTVRQWKQGANGAERHLEEREISGKLFFLPEQFALQGDITTEERARGIYKARLYHLDSKIQGKFAVPAGLGIDKDLADYHFQQPFIALGISDIRGIGAGLTLSVNGEARVFRPGSQLSLLGDGVHASLASVDVTKPLALDFALDLRLQGTSQLDIKPIGRDTRVTLNSDWPHPAFVGDYLPVSRTVNDSGFSARWSTSFFSTNLEEALQDCTERSRCESFNNRRLGVSFMDPVDHYVKSDRATKYALLFIALTFAGFFLFEVLKALAVHPVQYGMVGLALAFFYLLLLSLTEHIGFALAYGVSATLCVGLIGYYVGHVLQSRLRGLSFCAALAALYGLLYGLLSAEDYALLMGSLLLFGLLGAVMVMTRKVDWFKAGNQRTAE